MSSKTADWDPRAWSAAGSPAMSCARHHASLSPVGELHQSLLSMANLLIEIAFTAWVTSLASGNYWPLEYSCCNVGVRKACCGSYICLEYQRNSAHSDDEGHWSRIFRLVNHCSRQPDLTPTPLPSGRSVGQGKLQEVLNRAYRNKRIYI